MKTSLEQAIEIIHRLTRDPREVIRLPPSLDAKSLWTGNLLETLEPRKGKYPHPQEEILLTNVEIRKLQEYAFGKERWKNCPACAARREKEKLKKRREK